jgi:signal transduction histidine kinase
MKRNESGKSAAVHRRYLYLFIGLGVIFIAQMIWWIIFFFETTGDRLQPRHVRMLIIEGAFFVFLILAGLAIIYRVLRQQVIQRQQFKDFFAGFSHELKTPIASMLLQTETLQTIDLPREKQDHLLNNMIDDLSRLELTIENILDVFRFEAGRLRMDRKPVLIDDWLAQTVGSLSRAFADRSLTIDLDLRSNAVVELDDRYFQTVIANLLQNTVRYSIDSARLRVSCNLDGEEVRIVFSDTGIGIHPEALEEIFDRYHRIEVAEGLKHKGSGIGLFLSRQIVVAHGGNIWAESDGAGQGADFIITLPEVKEHAPGQDSGR